jgi:hypothetical protein
LARSTKLKQKLTAMDQTAKAIFLFTYLEDFKKLARSFFNVPAEEATLLYYQKIELFKEQLQQDCIDEAIAKRMYQDLSVSILKMYYRQKKSGGLWQLKAGPFRNTPAQTDPNTETFNQPSKPKK